MHSYATLFWLHVAPISARTAELPKAKQRSTAMFRFIGHPLGKARLLTQSGAPLDRSRGFAFVQQVLHNLTKPDLNARKTHGFARLEPTPPICRQLETCFDDPRYEVRFTAISDGQNKDAFWPNEKRTCALSNPHIKSRFMDIFLGGNIRAKSLTSSLKGK